MNTEFQLDTSSLSNEMKLLLSLLRAGTESGSIPDTASCEDALDWERFLELARHHRVYPVLHAGLAKRRSGGVPGWVREALLQEYQANIYYMLPLSAEMVRLCKLFAEQHIRTLLLKGPVLAAELYGDLSLRTSGDLDILIPIDDLERAEQLLVRQGFIKDDYIQSVLNDWKWRHHHFTFVHPSKRMKVELHWRLSPGPGKEPGFDDLWARKRTSTLTREPVQILGKEDLFLFLAAHGARHGWSRLRWLLDIDRMARQELKPALLLQLFRKYRQRHIGGQALLLASGLLRTPLPSELMRLTYGKRPGRLAKAALFYLKRMVSLHSDPIPEDVARYHKRHLFTLMAGSQKLVFLLSFLHPYPEDAETLPLPKRLHLIYFPLRPLLWLWRKSKKAGEALKGGAG